MSVPISNVPRRVVLVASGTGPYSFNFEILAAGDISVYRDDTLLTLTTDYTVTINSNGTGFVTLTAVPTGATQIAIVGDRAIQRTTDFTTGGDLFATSLNDELDSQTIFAQQNAEAVARALKAPQTDPLTIDMTLPRASERAGNYLTFDVNGDPQAGVSVVEVAGVYAIRNEIVAVAAIDTDVTTVAANDTNVSTVAGSIANVNLTGGSITSVNTVAGNTANINIVSGNISSVQTVATNIGNVNATGGSITNVNAVGSNLLGADTIGTVSANLLGTNTIGTVAGNISNVNAVGNNIANVSAVAGNSANINTTAANNANISTVAGSIANVNLTGGSITNVNTVAGNISNVNTVAGVSGNVTTVAGNISSVNTVAGISANVITVAGNTANINQVAADTAVINAASANAASAAASASSAATSATNAATSAAQANAVSLGNEPVRHTVRPSLLLDFANTKRLDPRITFTRTTTARFYDGKSVAKAEENLLWYSQEFDNAWWGKRNSSITANASTAPDGTTTADKLIANTSNAGHDILSAADAFTSQVNAQCTVSVFAKADGYNFVRVQLSGAGSNPLAFFDLQNGTVGTTVNNSGTVVSTSITSFGNGWYRCTVSATPNSGGTFNRGIFLVTNADNVGSFAGDNSSGILLWGAQLEQRSSVTSYTPTTTQPVTQYIPTLLTAPAGAARFDHNPVTGESLGLLIEEQRSNLLQRSEEFENAYWAKTRVSATSNTIIAPDGTLTGDKVFEDSTASNTHWIGGNFTATVAPYTLTAYLKAGERNWAALHLYNASSYYAYFNLSTGVIGTVTSGATGTITSVGNGWYRCSITVTLRAEDCFPSVFLASADNTVSYTGNGYSGIYIWGAQLEAGAFPTSYIKTEGSSVTRNADATNMTGANFSSWYRADSSTFYYDFADGNVSAHSGTAPFDTLVGAVTDGNRSGSQNSLVFSIGWKVRTKITTPEITLAIVSGSGGTTTISSTLKIATFLDQTAMGGSGNGGAVVTTSFTNPPSYPPNRFYLNGQLNGHIRKIAYYPARLSDAELQALTTV